MQKCLFFYLQVHAAVCISEKYIDAMIRTVVAVAAAAQIVVLLATKNYLAYLAIAIGATLLQNAAVSMKTDRLYPYLRERDIVPLPAEILGDIRRNVGAMILNRVGAVAVFSTDNILISKFVGVAAAGVYSNYAMIRSFLNLMTNTLFNALTPALGNLNATETEDERRRAFRRLRFFRRGCLAG